MKRAAGLTALTVATLTTICTIGFPPMRVATGAAQDAPATRPATAPATPRGTVDPDAPNLVHDRHFHARNPRHEASPDTRRFTTSRPEALSLPLPAEKDAFSFVVFGDRTGGPADGVNVLADAVRDVNLLEPDMVLTVGDLIQGYNEDPEYTVQAKEFKTIMNRLLCPWFPVAGNHDVYWRDKDRSGDAKPAGENEKKYETHFGPLWYAFEHKKSWFVVLYSDEGNRATNEKAFNKPELQTMSEEQFEWLKATLKRAAGAEHVFMFLHHPRWVGSQSAHEGYGNSWDRVHKLLVEAGNVTAVFGGHIHRMRYDPKDGIEYVTLATTGGGQNSTVPQAGWLHHYHVVTVRKNQVAMAAFPVGQAMDVREITNDLTEQTVKLARTNLDPKGAVKLAADGSADGLVRLTLKNPTSRPVEFTVTPETGDSRWTVGPDHLHKVLKPAEEATLTYRVRRVPSAWDGTLRPVELVVEAEYLAPGHRYAVPVRRVPVPTDFSEVPTVAGVLDLDGDGAALPLAASELKAIKGPFTIEARVRARRFKERQGLITKTQNSAYGIFLNNGRPSASVFLGDSYLAARGAAAATLEAGRWYHVAQVFDGKELRLYIDGKLVASGRRDAAMKDNDLPLIIGGDVDGTGSAVDTLDGSLDDVRVSRVARYTSEFTPQKGHTPDADTLLLLDFDRPVGRMTMDNSPERRILPLPTGAMVVREETSR